MINLGNKKIIDIYNKKINIMQAYKGSHLIWPTNNIIFEQYKNGEYNIDLPYEGFYDCIHIGAGGGGSKFIPYFDAFSTASSYACSGASGGYFNGTIWFPKNTSLNIVIGKGGIVNTNNIRSGRGGWTYIIASYIRDNETVNTKIIDDNAGNGGYAYQNGYSLGEAGNPFIYLTNSPVQEVSYPYIISDTLIKKEGNTGNGGNKIGVIYECPYPNENIKAGNGGTSGVDINPSNGSDGYVKITFLGKNL